MLAISPVWITLGPIVVINSILFLSYVFYQFWFSKRMKRDFAGAKKGGSKFLSGSTREWWFWTTNPIVNLFVKLKLGPNAITSAGFIFTCVSAILFALGSFGYAGWVMIFGASFDMFDGRVARITGKSSRSGAFFDAVMDRFSEGAVLLGLAYYFRESFMLPVVIIALIGSFLVSYTRARAESIGIECAVGSMQRPERIVYLGVASIFDPIIREVLKNYWAAPPPILMYIALILIAVMTTGTSIYRMIYAMNALDTADRRKKESLPQLLTRLSTQKGREDFWKRARYGYDRTRGAYSHIVLFLCGSIKASLTEEMLKRGELPNIEEHILRRGGLSNATTVFPSSIGPTTTPFVTGSFPGSCNIPGTRWFDRQVPLNRVITMNRLRDYAGWGAYVMDHDLSKSERTIFEYSRQAVNIFGMLNRGCGLVRDPAFLRTYGLINRAQDASEIDDVLETSFRWFKSAIRRETDFVLYSFPTADRDTLKKIDAYIGHAAKLLKKNNMYDETALMFSATFSQSACRNKFELAEFLSNRYKTYTSTRGRNWQDADIVALTSGTSMAHLYLKKDNDWSELSFFEDIERKGLIGSLLEKEGIDILAGRSVEGGIVVQSRRGRAHIHEDADGRITYLIKGADPFGFTNTPQVMDLAKSFEQGLKGNYPDVLAQLIQIFRSQRSGDLVISAKAGTSLLTEDVPLTNGSLSDEHMIVPLISSVPVVSDIIRTADVFALSLDMLGIEAAHQMDGRIPVPINQVEAGGMKQEAR